MRFSLLARCWFFLYLLLIKCVLSFFLRDALQSSSNTLSVLQNWLLIPIWGSYISNKSVHVNLLSRCLFDCGACMVVVSSALIPALPKNLGRCVSTYLPCVERVGRAFLSQRNWSATMRSGSQKLWSIFPSFHSLPHLSVTPTHKMAPLRPPGDQPVN
jgi:hypothetical protein